MINFLVDVCLLALFRTTVYLAVKLIALYHFNCWRLHVNKYLILRYRILLTASKDFYSPYMTFIMTIWQLDFNPSQNKHWADNMPLNKALGNSDAIILCTQCLDILLNKCPHAWIFPKVLQQTTIVSLTVKNKLVKHFQNTVSYATITFNFCWTTYIS